MRKCIANNTQEIKVSYWQSKDFISELQEEKYNNLEILKVGVEIWTAKIDPRRCHIIYQDAERTNNFIFALHLSSNRMSLTLIKINKMLLPKTILEKWKHIMN